MTPENESKPEHSSDLRNNSNPSELPKTDILSTQKLVFGFIFASIFGSISNTMSSASFTVIGSLTAGVVLLVVSGISFYMLRGVLRFSKIHLAQNASFAVFLIIIGLFGSLILIGGSFNKSQQAKQSAMSNPYAVLPKAVSPGMEEEIKDDLYRNNKWIFRIRFPKGWEIANGDGSHIIKKAIAANIGTVSVLVREIPGRISGTFQIEELQPMVDAMLAPTLQRLNGKIIEKKLVKINNRTFIYVKMRVVYENLKGTTAAINELYLTGEYGCIYNVTTSVAETLYQKYSHILMNSANTFEIEDYDEKAREAGFPVGN